MSWFEDIAERVMFVLTLALFCLAAYGAGQI